MFEHILDAQSDAVEVGPITSYTVPLDEIDTFIA